MAADEKVICLGEDIGKFGGVFRATSNLQKKYGKPRCFNTPLTEQGIAGFAVGLGGAGLGGGGRDTVCRLYLCRL